MWLVALVYSPWSVELTSEREESDTRLSGRPPPIPPSLALAVVLAVCWGAIGGTDGTSLARNGASSEVDFLMRFLMAGPLLEAGSGVFAVAAGRRNRAARLIRDGFFCSGSVSMVGAVVMMSGAAGRSAC